MFRRQSLVVYFLTAFVGVSSAAHAQPGEYGVDLPNPNIPGFNFPEAEATVNGWINAQPQNTAQLYLHGWGLWASLTSPSGQSVFGMQNAPVYQTWLSPQQVAIVNSSAKALASLSLERRTLTLRVPGQFARIKAVPKMLLKRLSVTGGYSLIRDNSVLETVAYSPAAAQWAQHQNLLSKANLRNLYTQGNAQIPVFPSNAVTVKPVYKLINKQHMIKGSSTYVMSAWPGTPDPAKVNPQTGFPEGQWPGCVYIDARNTGTSAANAVDSNCDTPTAANTFALGDFINIPVTAQNVGQITSLVSDTNVSVGDTLILMAMHVTSREITEWTWQTFFWTPDPKSPPLPSSQSVAAALPTQIKTSANHYAMSLAYQMISPPQPINGGISTGQPVIAYNPYLEAPFTSSTFKVSRPINNPNGGKPWVGTLGTQSNCMTCHSLASFKVNSDTGYGTDFYIPRNDPIFAGGIQTDFLWSIANDAK